MLSQISDLVETQQELGEGPAGTVPAMREAAARRAPWEVGTRAIVPRPTWVWRQGSAPAPAPPVFDPDPSPSDSPLLPHAWHEELAERLPPPHPSGCSAEAGGCAGLSIQAAGRASPGGVTDPKCWAGSSMGTAPLATLVWLMPKLADPIHGASHTSAIPMHEPHRWPTLAAF